MKYTRLYAGDDGHSHFEEVVVEDVHPLHEAPHQDVKGVSYYLANASKLMIGHIEQQNIDWHHPPSKKVLAVYLSGYIEMEVSSGDMRRFGPGDFCLIEDDIGKGHITRITESEGLRYIVIFLED